MNKTLFFSILILTSSAGVHASSDQSRKTLDLGGGMDITATRPTIELIQAIRDHSDSTFSELLEDDDFTELLQNENINEICQKSYYNNGDSYSGQTTPLIEAIELAHSTGNYDTATRIIYESYVNFNVKLRPVNYSSHSFTIKQFLTNELDRTVTFNPSFTRYKHAIEIRLS